MRAPIIILLLLDYRRDLTSIQLKLVLMILLTVIFNNNTIIVLVYAVAKKISLVF